MYSIDINFLRDRALNEESKTTIKPKTNSASFNDIIPTFGGVAVGLLALGAAGGWWWQVNNKTANINQEIQKIQAELDAAKAQNAEIGRLKGEIAKIDQEFQAFGSILNQVKPWSALLADIKDRMPPNIQLETITDNGLDEEKGFISVSIEGFGGTYTDVNNFLLTLQESSLVDSGKTFIESVDPTDNPITLETALKEGEDSPVLIKLKPEEVVEFTIQVALTDVSSLKLASELERKGLMASPLVIKSLSNRV
ncbi:MAG: hypothetical protein HC796_06505 [Synechococcaceae cyanobacterium RL_1_2]|nr:hypothetical protein [Synechococcaceae cyanobacterium RL_1_2]